MELKALTCIYLVNLRLSKKAKMTAVIIFPDNIWEYYKTLLECKALGGYKMFNLICNSKT